MLKLVLFRAAFYPLLAVGGMRNLCSYRVTLGHWLSDTTLGSATTLISFSLFKFGSERRIKMH